MRRSAILLALPFLLLACNTAPVPEGSSSSSASSASSVSSSAPVLPGKYQDPGIGYSIGIPAGWTTVENNEVIAAGYQAKGVAFVAPSEAGTTLDEASFHVAQVATCPQISGPQVTTKPMVIAGTFFQRSTWSEGAAGNLYEGITYTAPKDAGCLVLTGYLHSCNLGVDCGENHSAPFNKDAYIATFDAMARSVQFLEHPGD